MKDAYWLLSGLTACLFSAHQGHAQDTKHPNIILIVDDQHRGDALGCAGNPSVKTPNLDALASDGFLFNNAYSSCPSSTPGRSGLLTGLSPWHHGMLGYGAMAEHYKYEMPQMLRDQGYLTLGLGKMHWNPQNALHGFHATILDESGRRESPYFISDYHKWFELMAPGKDPNITGLGWNDHGAATYKLSEELHPTVWTGDIAVSAIEHFDQSKPLFLKVSFARPHSPYDPPQRILDEYKDVDVPAPAMGEWSKAIGADVTDPSSAPSAAYGNFGVDYAKNTRKHYYAAITFVDEQIGRIIEALKEKGIYDNTLICFISDHGDMMGDHNHWRKTYAYEGSAAIPFIVKFPKSIGTVRKPGEKIENPVELRDLLPTFLDVNGIATPEDMDGSSLVSLVSEEKPEWRRWIDMEHSACYKAKSDWCSLTDGKLKYIWFQCSGEEQLFDLQKDPDEQVELSKNKKYQKQLKELRAAMVNHLAERGEEWVKDGQLVVRKASQLYSPNFPKVSKD